MASKLNRSFEVQIALLIIFSGVVTLCLFICLAHIFSFPPLGTLALSFILLCVYYFYGYHYYISLVKWIYQFGNFIEAIRREDYSHHIRTSYGEGAVRQLYNEANQLQELIQQRKERYDQRVFLIYRLIEQLGTPVVIFDHRRHLDHANAAFNDFLGSPWQKSKGFKHSDIGFEVKENGQWYLTGERQNTIKWQLRQSFFEEEKGKYYLIVIIDIENEIRKTQQASWQQIIRVLSHEIRNSLTPINSISQTLLSEVEAGKEQLSESSYLALSTISNRSQALIQFVKNYTNINASIKLQKSNINFQEFFKKIKLLLPEARITIETGDGFLNMDEVLMEQVFINLIKNAVEASSNNSEIKVEFNQHSNKNTIKVLDNGTGILNKRDLFVPLFTTKKSGQGIGLILCRNIIEKHGGSLTLRNRVDGQGAEALVELPVDCNNPT